MGCKAQIPYSKLIQIQSHVGFTGTAQWEHRPLNLSPLISKQLGI